MKHAIALAAWLAACTPCCGQELQSVPSIQEQVNKVAGALSTGGPLQLNVAAIQELRSLNELAPDKAELVKQVAIFASGSGEQRPLGALAIMDLLDLPPRIVIPALAPHLDSENPKLQSFVRDWFQGHDNGGPDDPLKPVNFGDYADYVRGQQGNVPAPFVEYIYERSPGRALIVFYRASRRADAIAALQAEAKKLENAQQIAGVLPAPVKAKGPDELLLAECIVSHAIRLNNLNYDEALPEAKEQLAKLAKRKEWWVRLYVAEIMRGHPELRITDVLGGLRDDGNESVSKAAKVAG